MSFNEKLSYTEVVVETPTTDFTIGFSFTENIDKLGLLIDDVDATEAGYTYRLKNSMTLEVTPPIASGTVRIYRETNLDTTRHVFKAAAKFVAANMDTNFTQLLHSQQEIRDQTDAFYDRIDIQIEDFTNLVSDVQAEFQDVRDTANAAEATAEAANATSATALQVASRIESTAQQALDNSTEALNTANAIDAKAELALTNAASAVSTANTAETTANGIASTASNAVAIAENAQLTADNAEGTANDALLVAQDALDQTTLQPATATVLGGVMVGSEFSADVNGTLKLSGSVNRDLNVTGAIVATGNITAFSDVRLKYDINYICDALDKVTQLNGVTFRRTYDDVLSVGLIAQDVQRVLPEAIVQHGQYLTVDYLGIIGLLVEAIKDLNYKVHSLGG